MTKDIIYKKCINHGLLNQEDIIKAGISNDKQRYKCKKCMKHYHAQNYKKNKEKIDARLKNNKDKDPERYRTMKNESKRKCWHLNKEKYIQKTMEYDRRNPDKKSNRQRKFKNRYVKELSDGYIKQNIVRGTKLKFSNIPQSLVEAKKVVMLLKRQINILKLKE